MNQQIKNLPIEFFLEGTYFYSWDDKIWGMGTLQDIAKEIDGGIGDSKNPNFSHNKDFGKPCYLIDHESGEVFNWVMGRLHENKKITKFIPRDYSSFIIQMESQWEEEDWEEEEKANESLCDCGSSKCTWRGSLNCRYTNGS